MAPAYPGDYPGPSSGQPFPPGYPPVPPAQYKHPSGARRYGVAVAKTLLYLFLLVYVPFRILAALAGQTAVTTSLPLGLIFVGGIAIAILSGLSHAARPTRLYGPLSLSLASVSVAYLVIMSAFASITLAFGFGNSSPGGAPGSFAITIGWAPLLLLFAIAPAFGAAAALVTTIEDLLHPGERLPHDFPLQ